MDRFDRDILNHMLLWAPHGALFDEDVFPEFGMSVQQFRRRFVQLVEFYERAVTDTSESRPRRSSTGGGRPTLSPIL